MVLSMNVSTGRALFIHLMKFNTIHPQIIPLSWHFSILSNMQSFWNPSVFPQNISAKGKGSQPHYDNIFKCEQRELCKTYLLLHYSRQDSRE